MVLEIAFGLLSARRQRRNPAGRDGALAAPSRRPGPIGCWIREARAQRQLREFSRLDERLLRDIGLSRDALLCQSQNPIMADTRQQMQNDRR